uniref:Acetoacetyl-CoA synthetase n=1 Tax=Ursus americanus TaxID=9643 RepID=A0A452QI48_URSAM
MSKQLRASREEILECQVMWEPDSKKNTQMDRFRAAVGAACGLVLENYDDLYHWSVESYPDFWAEFWKFSGIVFSRMYDEVVDTSKGIADVPAWFKGSRLNYAENLLRHKENDRVALYAAREGKEEIVKVTFEELRQQVALFAAAMRKMGVKQGDRVVGYLPNGVHAVEAMLAAASIGAIWSSTSPDFGVNGVLDRFSQIQPKLIFSVEAVVYNGKEYSHMDKLQRVVKGLPDLKKVVLIPYIASKEKIDISKIPNSVFLDEFLATRKGEQAPQLEFEQLPFSHPLFVMFSSGTTGAPKCMVHSAGGTLIQHLKEHVLHGNMGSGDIMLYYTTVGWMMWNWMVSALATGAAVVLYDGSPLVPTPNVLWDLPHWLVPQTLLEMWPWRSSGLLWTCRELPCSVHRGRTALQSRRSWGEGCLGGQQASNTCSDCQRPLKEGCSSGVAGDLHLSCAPLLKIKTELHMVT